MAVSDNLGLYLPDREDYISVQRDLKSNYEIIDEHAGMVEDGIAIVINGDTAPRAITSGQYLMIKNHSTLATGGYHATANIANGASVTSSNVAADSDGIANALNSKITTIKHTQKTGTTNASGNFAFIEALGVVPLSGVPTSNNISLSFFKANSYWYVHAVGAGGETLANTEITFEFYYCTT